MIDNSPKWPDLLQEPFEQDADYTKSGTILEGVRVLQAESSKLTELELETIDKRESEYALLPAHTFGAKADVHSFDRGTLNTTHGLYKAKKVEMILPNGGILLNDGTAVATESTWQSRFQFHPHYKANRSTGWNYARIGPRDWTESIACFEEPVLLAYFRSYHQYYHWHIDTLPKLWFAKKNGLTEDASILAGPIARNSFQAASLAALGIDYDQLILPEERILRFEDAHLVFSESRESLKVRPSFQNGIHYKGGWDPEFLHWLSDVMTHATRDVQADRPKRIYVDRSKAHHRRLVDAEPMEEFLKANAFVFLDPGDYSLYEQCALFSEAEVVVGPHGAGLTNILWCNPEKDVRVMEIFPHGLEDTGYSFISSAYGFDHTVLFGEPYGPKKDAPAWTDIRIDPDLAIEIIRGLL